MDALTALKCLQALPMGLGGTIMAFDWLHGKVRRDFELKLGYPGWFPSVLGIWKLSCFAANWYASGRYSSTSQMMNAFHSGGVLYTHTVAEGKGLNVGSVSGGLIFLAMSVVGQVLIGDVALGETLLWHAGLFVSGFLSGYGVSGMAAKRTSERKKTANGPTKLQRRMSSVHYENMRGFVNPLVPKDNKDN